MTKNEFIYLTLLPLDKGFIKIGVSKADPNQRVNKLSKDLKTATGIPENHWLIYYWQVSDAFKIESVIKKTIPLSKANKEFYEVSIKTAIDTINSIVKQFESTIEMEFAAANEPEYIKHWRQLTFLRQQFIKFHVGIRFKLTNENLKQAIVNILEYSEQKKERDIALEFLAKITEPEQIFEIYNTQSEYRRRLIESFTNIELTENEYLKLFNTKDFDCKESKLFTDIKQLYVFDNLENLNISKTNIVNLEGIRYFKNLKTIDICQTKIDSILPLSKLKDLKTITSIGSGISKKDIDYFKKLMPEVSIITVTPGFETMQTK